MENTLRSNPWWHLLSAVGISVACQWAHAGGVSVELATPRCVEIGGEILVDLHIGVNAPNVVGLQSALTYDASVLQFIGPEAGDAPFDLPIFFTHNAVLHKIDLAVGISPGGSPSVGNVVAKRLRFLVLGNELDCLPAHSVSFRSDKQIRNLLTDSEGTPILPALSSLTELNTGPRPNVVAGADVLGVPPLGSMTLVTTLGVVTASGCGPGLSLTFVRSDGETNISAGYSRINSPVQITWRVTDECGRFAEDSQLVIVQVGLGDLTQDGTVDGGDLAVLLNAWGPAPSGLGDIDDDQVVDASDLAILLNNWGPVAP